MVEIGLKKYQAKTVIGDILLRLFMMPIVGVTLIGAMAVLMLSIPFIAILSLLSPFFTKVEEDALT